LFHKNNFSKDIKKAPKLIDASCNLTEIEQLEKIIENAKTAKCEWIDFTFGNGSSKSSVCNDDEIIANVREFLISLNERKLEKLKQTFSAL